MIVRTRRFKLNKPITFTDDITVTQVAGESILVISNGIEKATAEPIKETKDAQ